MDAEKEKKALELLDVDIFEFIFLAKMHIIKFWKPWFANLIIIYINSYKIKIRYLLIYIFN